MMMPAWITLGDASAEACSPWQPSIAHPESRIIYERDGGAVYLFYLNQIQAYLHYRLVSIYPERVLLQELINQQYHYLRQLINNLS
jgi:hypothetical protein